jgi:hypothetical protein
MTEPTAERPGFTPGYGIASDAEGIMPWSSAAEKIESSRNYWVSTARPDGRPHVAPVWGVWVEGALYFSTDDDSVKGKNIARSPEVAIHLESGDDVVILEGVMAKVYEAATMKKYADAYEKKYDIRPPEDPGAAMVLRPRKGFAWLERDFPNTATRYTFG